MLVIGNGESRKQINLDKINMAKIGCNALYRDYKVDNLVCVDKKMLKEVLKTSYKTNIYTRQDWFVNFRLDPRVKMLPNLPFTTESRMDQAINWGSGPYAVYLAANKSDTVHMLGFDLYSKDKKFNNIYKDTENYKPSASKAIDPSYWIYQISKVFTYFNNTQFFVYNDSSWEQPESWKLDNVLLDKTENLFYNKV